jgi:hypothetical protein
MPIGGSFEQSGQSIGTLSNIGTTVDEINGNYGKFSSLEKEYLGKMTSFNIFDIPLINTSVARFKSFVFITRPKLGLFKSPGSLDTHPGLDTDPNFKAMLETNKDLYKILDARCGDMAVNDYPYIYPLMNDLISYSLPKATFAIRGLPSNRRGHKVELPTDYDESMVNIPITLTFRMDKYASSFKIIDFWAKYVSAMARGRISPRIEDSIANRFEASVSIYHIITEEDGETIVAISKASGVYPTEIPYDIFSHNIRNVDVSNEFSVSFRAPFIRFNDPNLYHEFNKVMGGINNVGSSIDYINIGKTLENRGVDDYFCRKAVIIGYRNAQVTNSIIYTLKFGNTK